MYNVSTIGSYKYYLLHITDNFGGSYHQLAEWALYGGGFTIPSQVGHSGKILKTNGTSLKWEAPVDALLPAPQAADAGKIVTVNSTGDDVVYSNSVNLGGVTLGSNATQNYNLVLPATPGVRWELLEYIWHRFGWNHCSMSMGQCATKIN